MAQLTIMYANFIYCNYGANWTGELCVCVCSIAIFHCIEYAKESDCEFTFSRACVRRRSSHRTL